MVLLIRLTIGGLLHVLPLLGKMMLSKSVFLCAFRGQSNNEKPKNFSKILNLKAFVPFYFVGGTPPPFLK